MKKYKRIMFIIIILSVCMYFITQKPCLSFSLFPTCVDIDKSFYHHIIDPDIIEIGNSKYWAFCTVECEGVPRRNAFSKCAECPLFSDSSVKIAKNRLTVCEGDIIFVGDDQCTIRKMKKGRQNK
jgi:hypothetical protein